MKMKSCNFLCKIVADCKFWWQKTSILCDHEIIVFILVYKISPKIKEIVLEYVRDLNSF